MTLQICLSIHLKQPPLARGFNLVRSLKSGRSLTLPRTPSCHGRLAVFLSLALPPTTGHSRDAAVTRSETGGDGTLHMNGMSMQQSTSLLSCTCCSYSSSVLMHPDLQVMVQQPTSLVERVIANFQCKVVNPTNRLTHIGCSLFARYFFASFAFHHDAAYTKISAEPSVPLQLTGFVRKTCTALICLTIALTGEARSIAQF